MGVGGLTYRGFINVKKNLWGGGEEKKGLGRISPGLGGKGSFSEKGTKESLGEFARN